MPEEKSGLSAHIFTRDLRTDDNPALMAALGSSESVVTCFAAERELMRGDKKYRLSFLSQSLGELSADISKRGGSLRFYEGGAAELAEELCKAGANAIFCTRDYTPYAVMREKRLEKICRDNGCSFYAIPGSLLNEPEDVRKNDGGSYRVFTPFFWKAAQIPVPEPEGCGFTNFSDEDLFEESPPAGLSGSNPRLFDGGEIPAFTGGRSEGLRLLERIGKLENYNKDRDFPAKAGTSMLSAHLRFGTVSAREAFYAVSTSLGPEHALIRQLYWRDFFTHIAFLHPYVFTGPFDRRFESLPWNSSVELFERWCEGRTGFPLVDAGMREMNETGYMHNRVRMVAASFLVKDLHIDWRRGERYFASRLADYDPGVNNGNWQWAASTGCDAQPYFRIFNPWVQQKKFDPECLYIRRWIPEIAGLEPGEIHGLRMPDSVPPPGYPVPIIDHKKEAAAAKGIYSAIAQKKIVQKNLK